MQATKIKKTSWIGKVFSSLFSSWIENKSKIKCSRCKELIVLIGSNTVSILGFFGIVQTFWFFAVALLVAIVTVVLFIGFDYLSAVIDEAEEDVIAQQKKQIEELVSEKQALVRLNTCEMAKNKYLTSLWAETKLLVKAIQKANAQKNTKGLYSKIGNSIAEMTFSYLNTSKENVSVHLYAYDVKAGMVRRVDVESFVSTMQAADENEAKPIEDKDVCGRFYAKALLSKKTFFALPDNASIRNNLSFSDPEDEVIDQFTQYAAMVCDVGGYVKLYIEVISYNDMHLGSNVDEILIFLKKAIAPLSSILSMVSWNAIRSDCK